MRLVMYKLSQTKTAQPTTKSQAILIFIKSTPAEWLIKLKTSLLPRSSPNVACGDCVIALAYLNSQKSVFVEATTMVFSF